MSAYARNVFHKAIDALLSMKVSPPGMTSAPWIAEQIIHSQKFIVPDCGQMTVGMPFDELKGVMRLPFPRISLLREVTVPETDIELHIIVAVTPDLVRADDGGHCAFYVADAYYGKSVGWIPGGPLGVDLNPEGHGIQFWFIKGADVFADGDDETSMPGAMNGLAELLMMLSLANVGTRSVLAPAKLNKKRRANGNRPLYDYHVLTIDGQDVSDHVSPHSPSDRTIRSHFRRGHIRRLDEHRRIWVRASFVRGSMPGFVDKDYEVTHGKK